MNFGVTIELKRDSLDDDFRVCNQKIDCSVQLPVQFFTFVEKIVNTHIKEKELFVVKALVSVEVYTLYIAPYSSFKKEAKLQFLQTYDGDIIEIQQESQIF